MLVKLTNTKTRFTLERRLRGADSIMSVVESVRAPKILCRTLKETDPGVHVAKYKTWTLTVIDKVVAPVEAL